MREGLARVITSNAERLDLATPEPGRAGVCLTGASFDNARAMSKRIAYGAHGFLAGAKITFNWCGNHRRTPLVPWPT